MAVDDDLLFIARIVVSSSCIMNKSIDVLIEFFFRWNVLGQSSPVFFRMAKSPICFRNF